MSQHDMDSADLQLAAEPDHEYESWCPRARCDWYVGADELVTVVEALAQHEVDHSEHEALAPAHTVRVGDRVRLVGAGRRADWVLVVGSPIPTVDDSVTPHEQLVDIEVALDSGYRWFIQKPRDASLNVERSAGA